MQLNEIIKFKPHYSPEVELILGDNFTFCWSGKDENDEYVMYYNSAEVIEEGGELKISWNGYKMEPYHFLWCDHLDGQISMGAITKTHNYLTGKQYRNEK
jgi:hypothetical protein